MYIDPNYATKKAFKAAVEAGARLRAYNPAGFPINPDGWGTVEGPHYPAPHRWYARVLLSDGIVVKVK